MAHVEDWMKVLAEETEVAIDDDLMDRVLNLASLVAHATERKNAPVATFLAGQFVARALAQGATIEVALSDFRQRTKRHLPAAG